MIKQRNGKIKYVKVAMKREYAFALKEVYKCLQIERKFISGPEKAEMAVSASGESCTWLQAVLTAETAAGAAM